MKVALVNPHWRFEGSIYFGCREPHLPLEYGYAKVLLERIGAEVLIVDGHLERLSQEEVQSRVASFAPDFTVITSAPSYLFWRCAPPELRIPIEAARDLREVGGTLIAVGPHGSTTPTITLKKLEVDVVVLGEPEEILPLLVQKTAGEWRGIPSICYREGDEIRVQGGPHAGDLAALPPLRWPRALLARHPHHHHRFDAPPDGAGAEMETSRGCPYHCTFCAKDNFRDDYRKRPLAAIVEELDGLIEAGATYLYFIDEIFLPNQPLLEAIAERGIRFGVQTRIDLWTPPMLALLGRAGCVSIEAGVESITVEGRKWLDKPSRLSTDEMVDRLIIAKRHVPFVQANLLDAQFDDPEAIERWRERLRKEGVWANKPVPMFPYPGSPDYVRKWGLPDEAAWERAHEHYLREYETFSDIQEERPIPLPMLESHGSK
ncbi:MAG: TIGR04295 family B12-binding domain-containing radical SAM protein [Nitrospirae bacterium]|nr:TIGR04295 family B12-binding domain-containing radical SAM protein [Candidatus Manganitrophaceae bacterium]